MARWVTINGRRVLINGKSTVAVVAGVLALGVYASAGGGASSIAGQTVVGQAGSGSSVQLRARTSDGRKAARKGDNHGAWQKLGLKQVRQSLRLQAECLTVSFGEVREFFTRNRCTSLDRMMFAVVDEAGNTAMVSVVWVGLATTGDARDFLTLMDRPAAATSVRWAHPRWNWPTSRSPACATGATATASWSRSPKPRTPVAAGSTTTPWTRSLK